MLRIFKHFIKLLFSSKREFYKSLIEIVGFYPSRIEYYELALIHKSASVTESNGTSVNNERLEYLGDAILDAIVGDFLYHKFPKEHEGFLTQMRARIVNGDSLSDFAQRIGLNRFVVSHLHNTKGKTKVYEDAFEAFIGAIYLDQGYNTTRDFITNKIIRNFVDLKQLRETDNNFKSQLIEWGQKYKKEVSFETDLESEISKYFISYVIIDNEIYGSGSGVSKKIAEQKAAQATLEMVNGAIQNENKVTEQDA